ncbi:MAG: tetratricopeptide repeat protein [Alphaproteobacteria bacterium]|nr:tetratricopeptide repeat protein [Alphaproteobacteria bacterium]
MIFAGYFERGVPLMEKAASLNPNHPKWYFYSLSLAAYQQGDYDMAASYAEKADMPDFYYTWVYRAASYAQIGRHEKAGAAVRELLRLYPEFADSWVEEYRKWNAREDVIAHIGEGLEKAGLFDEPEPPSRPVIAVLPFDNLSGDPDQEYFADGITEDIITRLAQYPDILVLGRNTTFQFKGEAVDIPTIAEKLGADYVVEGSIRRGGDTVRVTAQLLGGDEWAHLWAETYDRTLDPANLFAMQDEITEAMASRIGDAHGVIGRAEFQRSSRHAPKRLSSYECILRFFAFERNFNAENHLVARDCLENVVKAEPDYGEALAFLGNTYFFEVTFGFNASEDPSLERALEFLERGVAIDPGSGRARIHLAQALYVTDNAKRAIREAEEALRIDPNNAAVIAYAGQVFVNTGEYERTEEVMAEVALTDPNYPAWVNWNMAKVHLARGAYADTIIRLEMTKMAWWYWTKAFMAAAYCAGADIERGRDELSAALAANPDFGKVYWPEIYFWNKTPNVRPMIDNLSAGLTACGWDAPPDPGREAFAAPQ